MTVCIVAICTHHEQGSEWPMIVGASDRMYTGSGGTWEPLQTKQFPLGTQAVGVFAGVAAANAAMFALTISKLAPFPNATVEMAAKEHSNSFAQFRREEAERSLLAPLGQGLYTYHTLPPPEVSRLTDELRRWDVDAEAIVAGLDMSGAHIYTIENPGIADSQDLLSFACIGSGAALASSEFMDQRYTRRFSPAAAFLMVYSAKKRAEVDPYVGPDTDLFVIGPGNGRYSYLNESITAKVIERYDEMRTAKRGIIAAAQDKVATDVEEIISAATQAAIQSGDTPAIAGADSAQQGDLGSGARSDRSEPSAS